MVVLVLFSIRVLTVIRAAGRSGCEGEVRKLRVGNEESEYEEGMSALLDEPGDRCEYFMASTDTVESLRAQLGLCKRVVLVGQTYLKGGLSVVLPRGSPLTEEVSKATSELQGNDAIAGMFDLDETKRCDREASISFHEVRGAYFLSLGVIVLLMITAGVHYFKEKADHTGLALHGNGEASE